ncbi:hypothetical protein [Coleofasciculus sp. E2-BRE-01]|uniref:hypothetical protein n=1 Tax=Coleofasciculus sp. E2-BRE-01 TaxID=3069524 RepID=UPI0032FE95AD
MNFMGKTASVLGVVGLSALATLSVPQSAKAVDLEKGFDQFLTFGDGGSSIVLPEIGIVPLVGTPVYPELSLSDTTLERLEDCTFVEGSCTVPLLIHELNLQSVDPVDLSPYGFDPSIVLIRLEGEQETGYITINQSSQTWRANLPVEAIALFPDGTPIVVPGFGPLEFYATAESEQLIGTGTFTTLEPFDAMGIFTGPFITDPSLSEPHPQEIHEVYPLPPFTVSKSVPEPSAVVPLALFGLAGLWGLKQKASRK